MDVVSVKPDTLSDVAGGLKELDLKIKDAERVVRESENILSSLKTEHANEVTRLAKLIKALPWASDLKRELVNT